MIDRTMATTLRSIWIAGYIILIVAMLILQAITALQIAEDNQRIISTSFNLNDDANNATRY